MRIDNNALDSDRKMDPLEILFCRKVESVLVKEPQMEYAEIVRAYREIEDEFVNHAGYVARDPLETKWLASFSARRGQFGKTYLNEVLLKSFVNTKMQKPDFWLSSRQATIPSSSMCTVTSQRSFSKTRIRVMRPSRFVSAYGVRGHKR